MNYKKIIDKNNIDKILYQLRKNNKKIVLCHGVFDLLHYGHLKHFETAKKQGDVLFVSVTHDQFIDKGFNRPFFKNQQRLESLSSISEIRTDISSFTSLSPSIAESTNTDTVLLMTSMMPPETKYLCFSLVPSANSKKSQRKDL